MSSMYDNKKLTIQINMRSHLLVGSSDFSLYKSFDYFATDKPNNASNLRSRIDSEIGSYIYPVRSSQKNKFDNIENIFTAYHFSNPPFDTFRFRKLIQMPVQVPLIRFKDIVYKELKHEI